MSEPIGPGDWVECISPTATDGAVPSIDGRHPEVGSVYCVLAVLPVVNKHGRRSDGIQLVGFANLSERRRPGAWGAAHFRPIYRPKGKQFIRELLRPVKENA